MIHLLNALYRGFSSRPKPIGLNKIAKAKIYLDAGMPWRAIETLEDKAPTYRPDPLGEATMLADIKTKFPDWQERKAKHLESQRTWKFKISKWLCRSGGKS